LQARGRSEEAEREVRALLDLMRENQAAVQANPAGCEKLLDQACLHLKILDLELGEEDLIKSVDAEFTNLRGM